LLDGLEDTTNRIFIKGFDVASTSEDDLREVFSGIGIISRVKQRTGFPDQWPYAVKIYRDERGEKKDEAVITYDDPHAAQSAPSFYDGYEFNGKKLHVSIAQSRPRPEGGAPPPPPGGGGDRGGYDRGGGRDYGRHRPY
jgi:RNA-binding protein FUS|tara:strand:+ start:14856 stop:15272 length:417 start_codon:yes stop_codon:yes gene_type:complete